MTPIDKLRKVVIDEARKVARALPSEHDLTLAVRALERWEARVTELEAQLAKEAAK
jgi:hypothetical protein